MTEDGTARVSAATLAAVDVVEVLRRASDAVEAAGVPSDLRALAFTTAVDLVVSGSGRPAPASAVEALTAAGGGPVGPSAGLAPAPRPAPSAPSHPSGADGPGPDPEGEWARLADRVGVRPQVLDRLWEERGGRLQLVVAVERLGRTRAARVGTAALLLLAALRWSGRDGGEPVPDAVVRAEVERLGLLDPGNYTKHLAARRSLLSPTGSGRGATYRLRYDGLEEAKRVARELLEDA